MRLSLGPIWYGRRPRWQLEQWSGSTRQRVMNSFSPDNGSKDVFVHISAVEKAGLSTLNEGAKVSYEEVPNKGKTSAENLRVGWLRKGMAKPAGSRRGFSRGSLRPGICSLTPCRLLASGLPHLNWTAFFLICRNELPHARLLYVPDHWADAVTNRIIPTGMVSRVDRAISPLSPPKTRIRHLANRRKIQTRAASRAGGQQRGPQR